MSDFRKAAKTREEGTPRADALMAGGVDLLSGGTDNHLMVCDLRRLDRSGKDAQNLLDVGGVHRDLPCVRP